jgi:hypothetical protein
MDEEKFKTNIVPCLYTSRKHIEKLQAIRQDRKVVLYIDNYYPLGLRESYAFHKVVRRLPAKSNIDLLLESLGGSIDAACSLTTMCKSRFSSLSVLVPFMAKSAATMIALMADEIVMASSSQLGPVDPIIKHPGTDVWIPAHSVRDALDFVEKTKDPYVKLTMADKLDPLLIGAFEDARNVSGQYIEEEMKSRDKNNVANIKAIFTERYRSHGYPITRQACKSAGLNVTFPDQELEDAMYEAHECCYDVLDAQDEPALLIQSENHFYASIGDFKKFAALTDYPLPSEHPRTTMKRKGPSTSGQKTSTKATKT